MSDWYLVYIFNPLKILACSQAAHRRSEGLLWRRGYCRSSSPTSDGCGCAVSGLKEARSYHAWVLECLLWSFQLPPLVVHNDADNWCAPCTLDLFPSIISIWLGSWHYSFSSSLPLMSQLLVWITKPDLQFWIALMVLHACLPYTIFCLVEASTTFASTIPCSYENLAQRCYFPLCSNIKCLRCSNGCHLWLSAKHQYKRWYPRVEQYSHCNRDLLNRFTIPYLEGT